MEAGLVAQLSRQCLAFVFQQVGDDHGRAFLDEQPRGLRAHAACAAGDDGYLVFQSFHAFFLD
ncbi:hypothetical protein D3C80_2202630 [compost metagenome]